MGPTQHRQSVSAADPRRLRQIFGPGLASRLVRSLELQARKLTKASKHDLLHLFFRDESVDPVAR